MGMTEKSGQMVLLENMRFQSLDGLSARHAPAQAVDGWMPPHPASAAKAAT